MVVLMLILLYHNPELVLVFLFNFVITSTINGAEVDRSADIYYSYNDPNINSIIVSRARFIDPLNNNSMQIYWSY